MKRGITITTHLVMCNPEGISLSYVSNWTGQAIKIPRNSFFDAKEFAEINRPGIYYLIGPNVENPEETLVYIGEANHLFERIMAHMRDEKKSFFELIIAFSYKDDNMTVSHTKYLEAKVLSETIEKSGYIIVNKKDGNRISLPQMVKDEMDTYFDNMKILLPSMGFDFFKPNSNSIKLNTKSKDEKLILEVGDVKATSKLISNGLLVLKGSLIKENETPALSPTYSRIRKDLLARGYIQKTKNGLEFMQDYEFSSPSQAGAVILGYSVNGRIFWKDIKGKTLKKIEEDKINTTPNKM